MVVVEMVERSTGRRPQGVPGGGRGRQPLGWAKFPHGYPHDGDDDLFIISGHS